jgi:hypothetical protein
MRNPRMRKTRRKRSARRKPPLVSAPCSDDLRRLRYGVYL